MPPCGYQEEVILEAFLDGTEPVDPCREEWAEIENLPWLFQMSYYTPKPGEPMPNMDAIDVADERLRRTPTPGEQSELDRLAELEGPEVAEKRRIQMGVKRPDPSAQDQD